MLRPPSERIRRPVDAEAKQLCHSIIRKVYLKPKTIHKPPVPRPPGSQSRHRLRSINPFWCTLSCGAFAIMCALSPMTSAVRCPSLAPCEFTVPLCRGHHRELHRHGDETAWWRKIGLDPTTRARTLWLQTHPLGASKLAVGAADCSWPSRPTPDTSLLDSLSAQVLHSGLAKGCLRC